MFPSLKRYALIIQLLMPVIASAQWQLGLKGGPSLQTITFQDAFVADRFRARWLGGFQVDFTRRLTPYISAELGIGLSDRGGWIHDRPRMDHPYEEYREYFSVRHMMFWIGPDLKVPMGNNWSLGSHLDFGLGVWLSEHHRNWEDGEFGAKHRVREAQFHGRYIGLRLMMGPDCKIAPRLHLVMNMGFEGQLNHALKLDFLKTRFAGVSTLVAVCYELRTAKNP